MKRTFAITTFAFAIVGVAACKGGAGGASTKLIPEGATIVGGVDLAAAQGTQGWKDNKEMIESQGKEALDAMEACNLGLDKWKSLTFGMDPEGGDDKMAFVVVADGVGKKENLECAAGKIKEQSEKDPWTVGEDGKVLTIDEGKAFAYVVDDNTIAFAGKAWSEDVQKLMKGEGKSAFDGALKSVIARTDTGKHVWFAGNLPESAKGMAKMAGDVGEPKDVAGWMDLGSGLEMFVAVGLASAEEAGKAKDVIQTQFDAMKGMAGQFGVPQGVIDSVKFETKDTAVTVSAKASEEELKTIEAKVKENLGGMM